MSTTDESEPIASRWMVTPVDEIDNEDDPGRTRRPKYLDDTDGVEGFSGTILNVPSAWGLPFDGDHFIVKVDAPESVLDALSDFDDVYAEGIDATKEQIADFLNERYREEQSFADWGGRFGTSRGRDRAAEARETATESANVNPDASAGGGSGSGSNPSGSGGE